MSVAVDTYAEFIQSKMRASTDVGFDSATSELLYPFQREIVEWSLRKGRAARESQGS